MDISIPSAIRYIINRMPDSHRENKIFMQAALEAAEAFFEDGCSQYNMAPRSVASDKTATTRAPDVRDESLLPPKVPNGRIENPCNFERNGWHYYSETPIMGRGSNIKDSSSNSQNNGNTQKMPTAQENRERACKMKEDERIRIYTLFSDNPMMLKLKIKELNQKYSEMGCPPDAPVNNPQENHSSSSSSGAPSSSSTQQSASSSTHSPSSSSKHATPAYSSTAQGSSSSTQSSSSAPSSSSSTARQSRLGHR
jgi:hypothetical protein